MDKTLYNDYEKLEKNHFWFHGRRRLLADFINRNLPTNINSALDIGCGAGFNLRLLAAKTNRLVGLEINKEAAAKARDDHQNFEIIDGSFPDVVIKEKFDLITLFDVLEHLKDDNNALLAAHSLLNDNGQILLTVPAYQFLWSEHDQLAHHHRRYTKKQLIKIIEQNGFIVTRVSYFNTILFIPIALLRLLYKTLSIKKSKSDFFLPPRPINNFLTRLFGSERFLLRLFNLPFGLSLICAARKNV